MFKLYKNNCILNSIYLASFSRLANVTIVPTGQGQTQRSPQMIVKKISASGRVVLMNTGPNLTSPQLAQISKVSPSIVTNTANQRGGPRYIYIFMIDAERLASIFVKLTPNFHTNLTKTRRKKNNS